MIERNLAPVLREAAEQYPVVTVTGPRQSGKTVLCRAVFGDHRYASLEPLDVRAAAREDPRGFLEELGPRALIDEVQHVPELLSYIQVASDEDPAPGRFVLTGSQHLGLLSGVAQTLAGRTAILNLLPLSLDEIARFPDLPSDLWETLWAGAYPRIPDRGIPAARWLSDYVTTYVQRDVRQVLNVGDLEAFDAFVRLCAGRTATEVNLSALGSDAGVSYNTARSWLSVLETGFLCFRAPAWRRSARKRIVKAPKLHFLDSGLVCNLLGIHDPGQLRNHPLRGQIFESWVASEIYKAQAHRGLPPRLHHYRDVKGLEVDLIVEGAKGTVAVEAKSGATVASDFLRPLQRLAESSEPARRVLVFGGEDRGRRRGTAILPWREIQAVDWR